MLYSCKPEFSQFLGVNEHVLRGARADMLRRDDIQPRMVVYNNRPTPNMFETDEDKVHGEGNFGIQYVMATIGGSQLTPPSLRDPIVDLMKKYKVHYQLLMSYGDAIGTPAARALKTLKAMTGVEFMLHMTYFNASRSGKWHQDFIGEFTPSKSEGERMEVVATMSLNVPFQGADHSYVEVQGGWTTAGRRNQAFFFNPRDSVHRVLVEHQVQRATMMFRTTQLTVEEFKAAVERVGYLEGEAK